MEFPNTYPIFAWVLMGGLGTACSILYSIVIWKWIISGQKKYGSEPHANASMLGLTFLFAGGLFACGIAGPPGYALSDDPSLINKDWMYRASFMSLLCSFIGWGLVLKGQLKTIKKKKNQLIQKTKDTSQSIVLNQTKAEAELV